MAFTTLQNRVFFPTARLLETGVELSSSLALFDRIFGYLDLEPDIVEPANPRDLPVERTAGRVTFDRVSLRYGEADGEWALSDVSIDLAPGSLVALVGPSGAGKSSLVNLVARLYDPTDGVVSLDGVDVRSLSFASLSRLVGVVSQESYLFGDTLRANIGYGRPDATDEQIHAAARAAAIHDRITELPEGYDTLVGERGVRLSGGERQRVAIARVLLHDPAVLVLDEATSALDTASERAVQEALATLMRGRSTLAVAHRLSTIQTADRIHVLDRGRVVESGTHGELVAAGGLYASLYKEQYDEGRIETWCADGLVYANGSCPWDGGDTSARATRLSSLPLDFRGLARSSSPCYYRTYVRVNALSGGGGRRRRRGSARHARPGAPARGRPRPTAPG